MNYVIKETMGKFSVDQTINQEAFWRDSDFIPRFCKIFEISKSISLILLSVKNEPSTPNFGTLLSKQVEIIAKKVSNFKTGLFWSKSQKTFYAIVISVKFWSGFGHFFSKNVYYSSAIAFLKSSFYENQEP